MLNAIAKPFGWLMLWLYEFIGDYGLAVIAFALIVKLILWPFMAKSKRSMLRSSRLQPKMKELEKRHGANKQKYNEEIQKLYKEEGINPMSGCLWSLIPFPILIALYQAIRQPITIMMGVSADLLQEGGALLEKLTSLGYTTSSATSAAYEEIAQAQFISANWAQHADEFLAIAPKLKNIDFSFFGFLDLGALPQWNFLWTTNWTDTAAWTAGLCLFLIPIIAALLTYVSTKVTARMNPQPEGATNSMQGLSIIMPIVTLWFAFVMPAALGLYWIASSAFGIIQDVIMTNRAKKKLAIEDADRLAAQQAREAELEAKRQEYERLKAENATTINPNTSKKKQQIKARTEQEMRTAEWERAHKKRQPVVEEPGRVDNRRYARGRAYDPNRFDPDYSSSEQLETSTDASDDATQPLPQPVDEDAVQPVAVTDEQENDVDNDLELVDDADLYDDNDDQGDSSDR
jgi:YidC/Oxa1 family membrane protein insertase